jgi:hypothetical protein
MVCEGHADTSLQELTVSMNEVTAASSLTHLFQHLASWSRSRSEHFDLRQITGHIKRRQTEGGVVGARLNQNKVRKWNNFSPTRLTRLDAFWAPA